MVRLVILCLLLLLSLLCVFRAPALYLWYLAIMVTEFPLVFMGLTALLLLWGFKVEKYAALGTVVGLVAFVLFLSPIVRAYIVSGKVNDEFEAAFGNGSAQIDDKQGDVPFRFGKMVTGINSIKNTYTTVTYKTIGNTPYMLDFYGHAHRDKGKRPCLVVVHGGSWAGGDRQQLPELNGYLSEWYNVATIDYRLAPMHHSPAAVDDLFDAIAYLKTHADELSIDTTKFVLLGRSAGAQIVSVAAYLDSDPAIKGVISYYGPADMIWGYKNPASPLVLPSCKIMEDYFGGTYDQLPQQYADGSPVELVKPGIVPTLMIHGVIDPLVAYEHSPRLIKKLQAVGAKYYLLTFPWGTHGCDYTLNGPSGQIGTYAVKRFMDYVVK